MRAPTRHVFFILLMVMALPAPVRAEDRGLLRSGVAFVDKDEGQVVPLTFRRRDYHDLDVDIYHRDGDEEVLVHEFRIPSKGPDETAVDVFLKPGRYLVETARVRGQGKTDELKLVPLQVINRRRLVEKQIVICDIDGTVIEEAPISLFFGVSVSPLPDARRVMNRLIQDPDKIVIYLTARPKSFAWFTFEETLDENGFLPAPVIFRRHSGQSQDDSKREVLRWLSDQGVELSKILFIGNSVVDVEAYRGALRDEGVSLSEARDRLLILDSKGMRNYFNQHADFTVVSGWRAIENRLYPKIEMPVDLECRQTSSPPSDSLKIFYSVDGETSSQGPQAPAK